MLFLIVLLLLDSDETGGTYIADVKQKPYVSYRIQQHQQLNTRDSLYGIEKV